MPSNDQIQELLDNCTSEWVTFNGANGRKFMSKNNEGKIFLPAAGDRCYDGLFSAGSNGDYWSSTQGPSDSYGAHPCHKEKSIKLNPLISDVHTQSHSATPQGVKDWLYMPTYLSAHPHQVGFSLHYPNHPTTQNRQLSIFRDFPL